MEKDDELKGSGNSYDFGDRIYDPRVSRFWKVDLFDKEMSNITPYRFGFNNPIRFSDGDGEFEIDEATAKAYPKLNAYLKNVSKIYASKPEAFRKAFKKYSELSDEQIKSMLEYKLVKTGAPLHKNQLNPRIEVKELKGANGQTDQSVQMEGGAIKSTSNIGSITLDKDNVDEFEKEHNTNVDREAANLVVESTLFHEATHYGDALSDNQLTQTGLKVVGGKLELDYSDGAGKQEGGKAFEKTVYGQDIDPSNVKGYVKDNNYNLANTKDAIESKSVIQPDNTRVAPKHKPNL